MDNSQVLISSKISFFLIPKDVEDQYSEYCDDLHKYDDTVRNIVMANEGLYIMVIATLLFMN